VKTIADQYLLFKSVRFVENDFATENDELRTPNADSSNNEHQSDWRGCRIHKTPTINDHYVIYLFPIELSLLWIISYLCKR
jgi:hypothetical protein